jgi:hypothetical protein
MRRGWRVSNQRLMERKALSRPFRCASCRFPCPRLGWQIATGEKAMQRRALRRFGSITFRSANPPNRPPARVGSDRRRRSKPMGDRSLTTQRGRSCPDPARMRRFYGGAALTAVGRRSVNVSREMGSRVSRPGFGPRVRNRMIGATGPIAPVSVFAGNGFAPTRRPSRRIRALDVVGLAHSRAPGAIRTEVGAQALRSSRVTPSKLRM